MSSIEWSQNFAVGVGEIDSQHKKLIGLIQELHEANVVDQEEAVVSKVLTSLLDYALYHFDTEEKLMLEHGYPAIERHMAEHKVFFDDILQIRSRAQSGQGDVASETMRFMKEWLTAHILGTDKALGRFLMSRGIL